MFKLFVLVSQLLALVHGYQQQNENGNWSKVVLEGTHCLDELAGYIVSPSLIEKLDILQLYASLLTHKTASLAMLA